MYDPALTMTRLHTATSESIYKFRAKSEGAKRAAPKTTVLVPSRNPRLLQDEEFQLQPSNRVWSGKHISYYFRRKRFRATQRCIRKILTVMPLTRSSYGSSHATVDATPREETQPEVPETPPADRRSYCMAPDRFEEPEGVMTLRYEAGLKSRCSQANPPSLPWKPLWRRNILCERCHEFSSGVEGSCVSCDVVLHYACMTPDEIEMNDRANFKCDDCSRSIAENDATFTFWKEKLKVLRHERQCVSKIVGILRRKCFRRRYLGLRTAALVLQNSIRRFLFWRRILKFRRTLTRPFEVQLIGLSGLTSPSHCLNPQPSDSANPYVVITVLDSFGKNQLFRFRSRDLGRGLSGELDDVFMIPGVTASAVVAFTVVHKRQPSEPQLTCDVFMGQAVLSLSQVISYGTTDRVFNLSLEDIEYVPMETKYQQLKMDAIEGYRPAGAIKVCIRPYFCIDGLVASCDGPATDVWRRKPQHISTLVGKSEMGHKKWYLVMAGPRLYVYKREGHSEPKYVLETKDFVSIQRFDHALLIVVTLNDYTRIPLSFDRTRQFHDWWFSLMVIVAANRNVSLPKLMQRMIVHRPDFWRDRVTVGPTSFHTAGAGGGVNAEKKAGGVSEVHGNTKRPSVTEGKPVKDP